MPNYSANPGDADLQAFLEAQGLWQDAYEAQAVGYVTGAVERFEEATGRLPYLAIPSQTLLFDAPTAETQYPRTPMGGVRMDLDTPFTAITAIAIDAGPNSPAGTPLTIGRDVYLRPDRHQIKRLPIESLEFVGGVGFGGRDSILVTGTPGSVAAWPPDVWNAVLAGAAADFAVDVVSASLPGTKGVVSWKEADAGETYDADGALAGNIAMWRGRWNSVVTRNIRVGAV